MITPDEVKKKRLEERQINKARRRTEEVYWVIDSHLESGDGINTDGIRIPIDDLSMINDNYILVGIPTDKWEPVLTAYRNNGWSVTIETKEAGFWFFKKKYRYLVFRPSL